MHSEHTDTHIHSHTPRPARADVSMAFELVCLCCSGNHIPILKNLMYRLKKQGQLPVLINMSLADDILYVVCVVESGLDYFE